MELVQINVECHAAYRADEYPKCFYWNEKRFEIKEISDRWYHHDLNPEWPVANYFKVNTTCNKLCLIKHEIEADKWYLVKVW